MLNELIILAIFNIENEEDQNFISDLHIKHYNLMYKKAFEYVENEYDAEDIVQKAYIELIKQISLLKTFNRHTLISYLVFTIRNTSLNFIKSRNRDNNKRVYEKDDEENIIDSIKDTETPEQIFLDDYNNETIHDAIDQLNPKYKAIIEYKYFKDMPDKEISTIMDITPDNVRKYLQRARTALKKVLEKEHDYYGIK